MLRREFYQMKMEIYITVGKASEVENNYLRIIMTVNLINIMIFGTITVTRSSYRGSLLPAAGMVTIRAITQPWPSNLKAPLRGFPRERISAVES